MPRYFFHLFDGSDPIIDHDGSSLTDEVAARTHAVGCVRGFASNCVLSGEPVRLGSYVTVQGEDGQEIHRVHFYDVIRFKPDEQLFSDR